MELPVPDVDGVDARGAALEQAVGEAAGGGTRIEGALAFDGDGEAVQRRVELLAAPADERRGRADEDNGLVRGDQAGRLGGRRTGDENGPCGNGRLRLVAGGDEATADQLGIEPAADPRGQLTPSWRTS